MPGDRQADEAFRPVINTPARGIGPKAMVILQEEAVFRRTPLLQAIETAPLPPKLRSAGLPFADAIRQVARQRPAVPRRGHRRCPPSAHDRDRLRVGRSKQDRPACRHRRRRLLRRAEGRDRARPDVQSARTGRGSRAPDLPALWLVALPLTARPPDLQPSGSLIPAAPRNPALDEYESRRCAICGGKYPSFGYGPPLTSRGAMLWACSAHRKDVDKRLSTRNIEGPAEPEQPSLF
jgi:hypothetical protein